MKTKTVFNKYIFSNSFQFLYSSSLDIINDPQAASSSVSTTASRPTESTTPSISTSVGQSDVPPSNLSQPQLFGSEKHTLDIDKETFWDSDFEAERDTPDWRQKMNQDELKRLRPKQQKRQDVINGKSKLDTDS